MNEKLPLVTIVTPSYNQGHFIQETIESVLSQDYPNVEYIVMDGASKDDTAEVCSRYLDRLTFISEKDRGQSHAINKGFQLARGEIVAWLNSDDIFLPGAIAAAVEAFRRRPEAGVVYGEGYQIDREGKIISRFASTQRFDLWRFLNVSDFILQQTAFFRRDVFDRVGWIDESLNYGMDWEILMRIGLEYPMEYIEEYMGAIREYPEAKTSAGGHRRAMELWKIMRRHGGLFVPPGALIYSLPVYDRAINAAIDQWPEAIARYAKPFGRISTRIMQRIVGWAVSSSQGLYADGWAGRRANLALPPARGRFFELTVSLPDWVPMERQTIYVRAGDTTLARETFGKGQFTLPVAVPQGLSEKSLIFQIDASHVFTPTPHSDGPTDPRRLAYLLHDLSYSG
jgi:glycosyltransferase involved in cell wall biosynthesis